MSINGLLVQSPKPLGVSSQSNSPLHTPKSSPRKQHIQLHPSPSKMSSSLANLQSDYTNLERSYADLLLHSKSLNREKVQLENEISIKDELLSEQSEKINKFENLLKTMRDEYEKNQELYEKELFYYKELVSDLEIKINKLSNELHKIEEKNQEKSNSNEVAEISKKYKQLLIDFRVLQSNFELEQNSKLVLMDQIEYYEKERLKEEVTTKANEAVDGLDSSREVHIDTYHTLNALQDQTDSSEDGFDTSDIGFVNGHSRMLSSLADEITSSSSPIKNRVPSLQTTSNFKFPPSPNPDSITNKAASTSISGGIEEGLHKRQSLPSKLKTSPHLEQEEFVLSPLKLTANHDYITSTSSYFDVSASTERRYSNSKPHHSRYNSHDILPIKVEFEQKDNNILRSTSVPERVHHERDAIHRNSIRNSAFMALHGAEKTTEKESSGASNRNSLLTESSSKRSSIIMDQSILTSDMTKQEIMKLKFELQSLKLHNEKLLSYIGFELQKQKKNIKKLSHKQSLSELNNNNNNNNNKKKMEYSDAKLIEKSKEMLIHKKRVLRSVSINPIISKGGNRNSQIIGKGLINQPEDSYQLFDGEDKYGFLSKEDSEKFNSRFFDNDMRHYYEIDEEDEEMEGGSIKLPKKFKSQVFRHTEYDSSEEYEDGDEEVESWQEESEQDTMTIYESVEQEPKEEQPEPSSVFSSIKYLFVGNTTTKKEKVNDSVDETLKYKFFLVAAGIMIIGIRFSHQQH